MQRTLGCASIDVWIQNLPAVSDILKNFPLLIGCIVAVLLFGLVLLSLKRPNTLDEYVGYSKPTPAEQDAAGAAVPTGVEFPDRSLLNERRRSVVFVVVDCSSLPSYARVRPCHGRGNLKWPIENLRDKNLCETLLEPPSSYCLRVLYVRRRAR